jgi:DNA-binding phage protein
MDKIKTSPKRRPSTLKPLRTKRYKAAIRNKETAKVTLREDANITEVDPIANLLDPNLIGSAIMQCLIENDPEGVMEIIKDHLYALNKSKFLREADVPRSTMYQLLKRKNPTIKTLAKIMYATHH